MLMTPSIDRTTTATFVGGSGRHRIIGGGGGASMCKVRYSG